MFQWQGLDSDSQAVSGDPEQLAVVLDQLEGLEMPAAAWEDAILPSRIHGYLNYWMDMLSGSGRTMWLRVNAPEKSLVNGAGKQTPIAFSSRQNVHHWTDRATSPVVEQALSSQGARIVRILAQKGAQFFEFA